MTANFVAASLKNDLHARMSFRPFLPLMFIGDPADKEAYNVSGNRFKSSRNGRKEAEEQETEAFRFEVRAETE